MVIQPLSIADAFTRLVLELGASVVLGGILLALFILLVNALRS